jgi:RNA-directed DNA polymerase
MGLEGRGSIIQVLENIEGNCLTAGGTEMKKTKPFTIGKLEVMNAYNKVKANKGSGGVDQMSLQDFELDKANHLYKLWNQMSSGSYIPSAVKLVEIPKKGGGKRPLGIPTIVDRVGQTVVKDLLEKDMDKVFHDDSYGYRPNKSAHQALEQARKRCWKFDWVIDMDIRGYFDNIPHDLLLKAVRRHTEIKWVLLYIERWLVAPLQLEDGTIEARAKGVPQGSVIGPLLANLYLHYVMDMWLSRNHPDCPFERYADDSVIHCTSRPKAERVLQLLAERMKECGLEMHPEKTKIVYCKDSNRRRKFEPYGEFDFLGHTFRPRQAQHSGRKETFSCWLPAVSRKSKQSMTEKMKSWTILRASDVQIEDIAKAINPVLRGWINYYGKFYRTELKDFMQSVNRMIARWARRKYKKLRTSLLKAIMWLKGISVRQPALFPHWELGSKPF